MDLLGGLGRCCTGRCRRDPLGRLDRRSAPAAFSDCPVLTKLQVHEARRGSGVGTALIQVAEESVRPRGFCRVGIAVADDDRKDTTRL